MIIIPKLYSVRINQTITILLIITLGLSSIFAKDTSKVNNLQEMFTRGKITGQLISAYAHYNQKEQGNTGMYSTGVGGMFKYELAVYNGFNAGAALTTAYDIGFMSGNKRLSKNNSELSSVAGHYTELTEAYLNYKNGGLNMRVGRQTVDTPLADTDHVRMVQNTFEAYVMTYEFNHLSFIFANIQKWQGAGTGLGFDENDNKLSSNWVDTGRNGVWLGGVTYSYGIDYSAWYYDISQQEYAAKVIYLDMGRKHTINENISFYAGVQYLHESEVDNSGIAADAYGASLELVASDFTFSVAYNQSQAKAGKSAFSGFGGGILYTCMDTMNVETISLDRDVKALVVAIGYTFEDIEVLYVYGDFNGGKDSSGDKAHSIEQNLGFTYALNNGLSAEAIYVKEEDKINSAKTENDWDRLQVIVKYDF